MKPSPRILVALVLGLAGCPRATGPTTPEGAVETFSSAIRAGDYEAAYAMMSETYRRRVPFEEFREHLEAHPDEARALAAEMDGATERVEVTATVPYGEGEELRMLHEDGEWRLVGNVVDFYDQSTPRAALRSFIRAMERQRYDVVMRFVPSADREGMTVDKMREAWEGEGREEVERLLANLRANLDNPIEVVGDRATMPYGERFAVHFVREDGVWKIEDPD